MSFRFHCFFLYQRSRIYKWDGTTKNRSQSQWQKLEHVNLELPKDTLIEVEKVEELRGEVRCI